MNNKEFIQFCNIMMVANESKIGHRPMMERKNLHKKVLTVAKSFKFPGAEFDYIDWDNSFTQIFVRGGSLPLMAVRFKPEFVKNTNKKDLKEKFQTALNKHFSNKIGNCRISWPSIPKNDNSGIYHITGDFFTGDSIVKLYIP